VEARLGASRSTPKAIRASRGRGSSRQRARAAPSHSASTVRALRERLGRLRGVCGLRAPRSRRAAGHLADGLAVGEGARGPEGPKQRCPRKLVRRRSGLALATQRRRLASIASRYATQGLETATDHPLVRRCCATRAFAARRRRRTRCSSSASRQSCRWYPGFVNDNVAGTDQDAPA
jgi:hypothetical protein